MTVFIKSRSKNSRKASGNHNSNQTRTVIPASCSIVPSTFHPSSISFYVRSTVGQFTHPRHSLTSTSSSPTVLKINARAGAQTRTDASKKGKKKKSKNRATFAYLFFIFSFSFLFVLCSKLRSYRHRQGRIALPNLDFSFMCLCILMEREISQCSVRAWAYNCFFSILWLLLLFAFPLLYSYK